MRRWLFACLVLLPAALALAAVWCLPFANPRGGFRNGTVGV